MGASLNPASKVDASTIHFVLTQETEKAKTELSVGEEGYNIRTSSKTRSFLEIIKSFLGFKDFDVKIVELFSPWTADEKKVFVFLKSLIEDKKITLIQKASHDPSVKTLVEWERKEILPTFKKASEVYLNTFNHPQKKSSEVVNLLLFKEAIDGKYKALCAQLTEIVQSDDKLKKAYADSKIVELKKEEQEILQKIKEEQEIVQRLEQPLSLEEMEKLSKEFFGSEVVAESKEVQDPEFVTRYLKGSTMMYQEKLERIREEIKTAEKAIEPSSQK